MSKAYLFRHQHGGVDTTIAFASTPTVEQMQALNDKADAIYGVGWAMPVEINIIDDATVPVFDQPGAAQGDNPGAASTQIDLMTFGAVGHVEEIL
jgi:hypothetical protein